MGEDQHGVILHHVLAHIVFLDLLAVGNGELRVGALGIQNVHVEVVAPAVVFHELVVLFGGVASAVVGSVALYHRALDGIDHGFHKFGPQKVLVALFTGVDLHGHLAGKLLA